MAEETEHWISVKIVYLNDILPLIKQGPEIVRLDAVYEPRTVLKDTCLYFRPHFCNTWAQNRAAGTL